MGWRFVLEGEDGPEVEHVRDRVARLANQISIDYPHLDPESSFTDALPDEGAWEARDRRDPTNAANPEERLKTIRAKEGGI